ncbi:alpha/beta hydrolase [Archangium violaceum]|uniref:alpha/beta fold hydrolase n=1 Tax=Archangium violaceum TaxID=83451 RepID=UPI0019526B00|nr:alpha/beta hydrolase [Archangium violaceum]QRN94505.1 alpha/beta hydrolase [Archangium violaceum]
MNTTSLHITRWGDSGPRVVMIHGSAQGSAVGGDRHFSAQARLAERGWRVIVPDRPGHGRSPAPGRPDDAEADGAWVAELLEDGAHLVGHSFGGCVAVAAAAKRPSAVRSLTLIEPGMQMIAMRDSRVRRQVLSLLLAKVLPGSAATRAARFGKLMRIPPDIRGGTSPEELERMGRGLAQLRLPAKEMLQRQLGDIQRERIPLWVVTGGWNPGIEATADAVAALGGGRRHVIASPHHFPQLVSDEFNELLVTFMKESDARHTY